MSGRQRQWLRHTSLSNGDLILKKILHSRPYCNWCIAFVNVFNLHYTWIVAEQILKCRYSKNLEKQKYHCNKFYLTYLRKVRKLPTLPIEIEDIITKLETKKKTGPNSLPQPILKSISTPLSNLLKMSFS